ncbi:stage II sporulation protein P [Fictibacillus sp. NRS-1165]|uniref:stage II sporulation protein P n=1 Tax=Fictibacillus sp. NRS-1165 TaxID=3144463 RepID=UPI003D248146
MRDSNNRLFSTGIKVSLLSILLFFVAGFISSSEIKFDVSSSLVKKWFNNFTTEALVYAIGSENPYYTQVLPKESKPPAASSIMLQLMTNLRPGDPRSLIGTELPGFAIYDSEIYIAGKGTTYSTLPIEPTLPLQEILKPNEPNKKNVDIDKPQENIPPPKLKTKGEVVYIYHSHSYESFRPILQGGKFTSSNPKTNIIAVGDRLKQDLESRGIGVDHDTTNVGEKLNARKWSTNRAYALSRETVQHAISQDRNLSYLIDIHRDSQPRKMTTITIKNQPYARLCFIVGREHPSFEKNLQIAEELNRLVNKQYPHLSRGVIIKNKSQGNGIYNQDLSNNAMLIEMGGIDNDFRELYRTADAFADVFSSYYWQAEKVNGDAN